MNTHSELVSHLRYICTLIDMGVDDNALADFSDEMKAIGIGVSA